MLSSSLYTSEEKDYFSLVRFRKIIINALAIDEFDWVEKFVDNYLARLPQQYRDGMYYYSQALLNFRKKNFDAALENISKVKFEIYSVKFDAWGIKLKSEYELGYYEEAAYSLDSYKHSINTDKTSPHWMKARFQNFMNYFGKILKRKENEIDFFGKEKKDMVNEISNTKEIIDKSWLTEKVGE
jgi:tetratricopeptide (TPR) repeat protein